MLTSPEQEKVRLGKNAHCTCISCNLNINIMKLLFQSQIVVELRCQIWDKDDRRSTPQAYTLPIDQVSETPAPTIPQMLHHIGRIIID